jgi:predicted dehydrogenase
MVVGVVGRGYWGNTYCRVLTGLGIEYWQAGRDWKDQPRPDRLIIASSTASHYEVACDAMDLGLPVLIEKPATETQEQVEALIKRGGTAFVGHTRLYDPAWRAFKASLPRNIDRVEAWCGGISESDPDPEKNWLHHLIPMCVDIGAYRCTHRFHITKEKQPLRFVVHGREFRDTAGALENLVTSFLTGSGNWGLYLNYLTHLYMERTWPSERMPS